MAQTKSSLRMGIDVILQGTTTGISGVAITGLDNYETESNETGLEGRTMDGD